MDVYDDLDNYQQIINYEQLKIENQEMKIKLEEYGISMENLKKDILQELDNLSNEHRRLMVNYSTLLKTARAEIERKTQTIVQINAEKDKLFLRLINNNKGKNPAQFKGNPPHQRNSPNLRSSSDVAVKKQTSHERSTNHEQQRLPHKDKEPPREPQQKNVFQQKGDLRNNKENFINTAKKPMSIASRRKSMPAFRQEIKFSSDEEGEIVSLEGESDKISCTDKSKASATSSNEDRYHTNIKLSAKESFPSNRPSRFNKEIYGQYREAEDMYKGKEREHNRYNPGRYNRDRAPKRDYREYREQTRSGRMLHSPPRDKYYRTRSRDRRSRYEREEWERDYDRNDRSNDRRHEYTRYNRPLPNDNINEPARKRQRINSHTNSDMNSDGYLTATETFTAISQNIEQNTCQSPDEAILDKYDEADPVKEIMINEDIRLADPRLESDQYMQVLDRKNRPCIIAKKAIDIDLIPLRPWEEKEDIMYKTVPATVENDVHSEIYDENIDPLEDVPEDDIADDLLFGSGDVDSAAQSDVDNNINVPHSQMNNREPPKTEELPRNVVNKKYVIPKIKDRRQETPETKTQQPTPKPLDIMYKDLINSVNVPKDKEDRNEKHRSPSSDAVTTSNNYKNRQECISIVQGDLELSDDASGNNEPFNSVVEQTKTTEQVHENTDKTSKKKQSKEKENPSKSKSDKTKRKDDGKKHKDKTKKKEETKDKSKTKSKTNSSSEKKTESVVVDKNSQDINAKFTDLFGDSSLITPEDLNIPKSHENSNKAATDESSQDTLYSLKNVDSSNFKNNPEISSYVKDISLGEKPNRYEVSSGEKAQIVKPLVEVGTNNNGEINISNEHSKGTDKEGKEPINGRTTPDSVAKKIEQSDKTLSPNNSECKSFLSDGSFTHTNDVPDLKIVLKRKRRVIKK